MLLHMFRLKIRNKYFILKDRTKIPLTMEHEVREITVYPILNFYSHLKQLYKKVANKLNALTRIRISL